MWQANPLAVTPTREATDESYEAFARKFGIMKRANFGHSVYRGRQAKLLEDNQNRLIRKFSKSAEDLVEVTDKSVY